MEDLRSLHSEIDDISREATTFRLLFFQENQFPSLGGPTPVLPTGIWGGFDGNVFDENNIRAHYLTTNAKTEEEMIQRCHAFYTTQSFRNNGFVVSVEHNCCSSLHWLLPTCTERNPVLHVLLGYLTEQEIEERLKDHLKYAADTAPVNARIADALEKSRLQYVYDCFHETLHPALNSAHQARRIDPVTHAWGDQDAEFEKYYMRAAQASMPGAHKAPWLLLKTSAPDAFADWPRGEKIESERLESMLPLFQTSVHKALREAHESRRGNDDWGNESQNECEVMAWYTMFALREASSLNIQEFLVGEANAFEDARLTALLHCFKDFVHDALRKAHAKRRNEPVKYAWGDQSAATDEAFYDDVLRAEGVLHDGCQTSRFPGF